MAVLIFNWLVLIISLTFMNFSFFSKFPKKWEMGQIDEFIIIVVSSVTFIVSSLTLILI